MYVDKLMLDLIELNLEDDDEIQQVNLKYNLLANICHEGDAKVGFYKVHVRNKAKNTW